MTLQMTNIDWLMIADEFYLGFHLYCCCHSYYIVLFINFVFSIIIIVILDNLGHFKCLLSFNLFSIQIDLGQVFLCSLKLISLWKYKPYIFSRSSFKLFCNYLNLLFSFPSLFCFLFFLLLFHPFFFFLQIFPFKYFNRFYSYICKVISWSVCHLKKTKN